MAANGGDGSSWASAISLQQALARAVAGDDIFVASGTYFTTNDGNRNAAFVIPAGVALYGGFVGNEQSLNQRPYGGAPSILSGNIGAPHSAEDNAYTVVALRSSGNQISTLDGFLISEGVGRSFTEGMQPSNVGGGLFVEAAAYGQAAHRISNCVFQSNSAHNGGAVYIQGSSPVFTNCTFTGNQADFYGGAVYTQATASQASPVFRNCNFTGNKSNSGAGMTNNGTNGNASPLIVSCQFTNNSSLLNGAAIFNVTNANGEAEPIIKDCAFVGNASVLNDDVSGTSTNPTVGGGGATYAGGTLRPTTARRK